MGKGGRKTVRHVSNERGNQRGMEAVLGRQKRQLFNPEWGEIGMRGKEGNRKRGREKRKALE